VPFLLWGRGINPNGAARFTEAEAKKTGVFVAEGYKKMSKLVGK
jgi:2,3-bisphosphoglycerate-independent phosphoglycerate mutase